MSIGEHKAENGAAPQTDSDSERNDRRHCEKGSDEAIHGPKGARRPDGLLYRLKPGSQ